MGKLRRRDHKSLSVIRFPPVLIEEGAAIQLYVYRQRMESWPCGKLLKPSVASRCEKHRSIKIRPTYCEKRPMRCPSGLHVCRDRDGKARGLDTMFPIRLLHIVDKIQCLLCTALAKSTSHVTRVTSSKLSFTGAYKAETLTTQDVLKGPPVRSIPLWSPQGLLRVLETGSLRCLRLKLRIWRFLLLHPPRRAYPEQTRSRTAT